MAGGREIEFKFLATHSDIEAVLGLDAFAPVRKAEPRLQVSTYYDTPDRQIEKAGFILRLRDAGGRYIQTVKSEGRGLERGEWEWELDTPHVDFDRAAETPMAGHLADAGLRERIGPVLTTRVNRRKAEITFTVARVEVAIDEGEIVAGEQTSPICEIELELKGGRRRGLFALARKLSRTAPVALSLISKGERGFRLAAGEWGNPVKMAPPKLDPDMPTADAFSAIGHSCLRQVMLNAPALDAGHEVEAVHQTRVGIRRLRAALNLFRPVVKDERYAKLKTDLKWLSNHLGVARDIDVLLAETIEPALTEEPAIAGLDQLAQIVRARQMEARAQLRQALASTRCRRLMVDLVLWLEDGSWRHPRPLHETDAGDGPTVEQLELVIETGWSASEPLRDFIAKRLSSRRKRLARLSDNLETLSGPELHEIRIQAKKLRYQAAFFQSLAPRGKSHRRLAKLLRALEDAQESLGSVQDSEATSAFLESAAKGTLRGRQQDPMILFAAGRLAGAHPDREELVKRASKAVEDALSTKAFWKKL